MEILDGFTSNPTIKSADKKDVQKSHITENDSSASDEYYVADIASKIDKDAYAAVQPLLLQRLLLTRMTRKWPRPFPLSSYSIFWRQFSFLRLEL